MWLTTRTAKDEWYSNVLGCNAILDAQNLLHVAQLDVGPVNGVDNLSACVVSVWVCGGSSLPPSSRCGSPSSRPNTSVRTSEEYVAASFTASAFGCDYLPCNTLRWFTVWVRFEISAISVSYV